MRPSLCCLFALITRLLNSGTDALCYQQGVERTIGVEFRSRLNQMGNKGKEWELVANVTWQRPQPDYGSIAYAVRAVLSQGTEQLGIGNCSLAGLSETEEESYLFTGLSYGYKYFFGVSVIDGNKRKSREDYIQEETPDCYLATGDREFCRAQSVEISGVPIDFQLDCAAAPASDDEETPDHYMVALSWSTPIQVSGEVTAYELRYGQSGHRLESFDSAPLIEAKQNASVYIEQLHGLQEMSNYTAIVRAFVDGKGGPKAFLYFNTYNDKLNNYTHQNGICEKMERRLADSSLPTDIVTEQAPSAVGPIVGPLMALVVLGGALFITCAIKKRKNAAESKEAIFVRYPEEGRGRKETADGNITLDEQREPEADFQAREVDRSLLTINDKLGKGQFGIVYNGIISPRDSMNKKYAPRPVAVKSLKLSATREMKEDFLDEIKLIIDIGNHPNILPILGCCTLDEPYYLIMEFMKYGDLLGFLWKCRDENYQTEDPVYRMTEVGQLQIARQIARGMEYLANTRYYHGDLAARNVLVGEGLVVKISDFGMADDIYQRGYKRISQEKKRPLKWVSLETNIKGTCSIKSDVWSFGIVLYEIYTLGGVPYPGMDGFEVVRQLENGYRMEQPDSCPEEIYIVMLKCWHEKPDLRPSFTGLFDKLDRLLSEMSSEYFTGLELDADQLSQATESTTYGYENSLAGTMLLSPSLSLGSDDDSAHYDSLKAIGWRPVPVVTVECIDNTLQMEVNS